MKHILDYYINPSNKILGQDKSLVIDRKNNYFSQVLVFEDNIPNIDNHLQNFVCKWFIQPRSVLRANLPSGEKYVHYDKSSTNILCQRFLQKVNHISIEDIEKYAIDNDYTAVLFYTEKSLCMCCSHIFFDGIAAYNLLQEVFDNDHKFEVGHFIYIPGFQEINIIAKCGSYLSPTQKYLTYDLDCNKTNEYCTLRLRHLLSSYKKIKSRCMLKVSFASVLVSKMLRRLFSVTGVTVLSFGVLVAMNSKCRFNNFAVITCEISRPTASEGDAAYAMRVHQTIEKRKEMVVASFVVSNIYGVSMSGKGNIDVLFSGMPMTLDKPITINGVRLKKVESNMRNTSMPVYCGYLSCDRYVNLYFNIRTNMVDREKLACSLGCKKR